MSDRDRARCRGQRAAGDHKNPASFSNEVDPLGFFRTMKHLPEVMDEILLIVFALSVKLSNRISSKASDESLLSSLMPISLLAD